MSMNYRNVRLRVGHLYPSLLNVAGDGGNLMAIERRCAWRGLAVDAVPINPGERPDFTSFDLILFHGGQDVEMEIAAEDLRGKAASLRQAAGEGVVTLAVCAGLQLLGHRYVPANGAAIDRIGVAGFETPPGSQQVKLHACC